MNKYLFLLALLSWSALAQNSELETVTHLFNLGTTSQENFIDFVNTHNCEVGLTKGCDRPMPLLDLEKMKVLLKKVGIWKLETINAYLDHTTPLHSKPLKVIQGNFFALKDQGSFIEVTLDPAQEESQAFIAKIRMDVILRLEFYDYFFRLTSLLSKASKLNSLLSFDTKSQGSVLQDYYQQAMDADFWKTTRNGVVFLEAEKKIRGEVTLPHGQKSFDQYYAVSFTRESVVTKSASQFMTSLLKLADLSARTGGAHIFEVIAGKLSQFFGNAVGAVQFRDGKLKQLASDPEFVNGMKRKLRSMDILIEKTPFRLTDKFIPGYYGHVAIWLGNPEELFELTVEFEGRMIQLLDHPDVTPHLEALSQGKMVLEALRSGVQMNTFEHFLDVDDLVVVSQKKEFALTGEHVLRAFQQVGKPYDFNFDVETEDAIVCSEIVYTVFPDTQWPIDREVGRFTISPDHVVWKAVQDCFEMKALYIDGKEVSSELRWTLEKNLLKPGGIDHTPVGNCEK